MSFWQMIFRKKPPSGEVDTNPAGGESVMQLVATAEPLPRRPQDIRKDEPTALDDELAKHAYFNQDPDRTEGQER